MRREPRRASRAPSPQTTARAEKRRHQRLPLQLVLSIDRPERMVGAHCVSRDVSSGGMYFYAEAWDERITRFEFCAVLPAQFTAANPAVAKCSGRVLRVERETLGKVGIAARIESWMVM